MAYDDTHCPCGGKKITETMLCEACEHYLAEHPEMRVMRDEIYSVNHRRSAAITLLALARRRKRAPVGNGVDTARAIAGAMRPQLQVSRTSVKAGRAAAEGSADGNGEANDEALRPADKGGSNGN